MLRLLLVTAALASATRCATLPPPQLTPAPCSSDVSTQVHCGNYRVEEVRETFDDPKRRRVVPITAYVPVSTSERFPLILFSHGIGNSNDGYRYLGRFWASHGYVVVHVGHRGTDTRALRDRGAVRLFFKVFDRDQWQKRVDDVLFAKQRVLEGALGNRIDATRVGAAGHSYGALAALQMSGPANDGTVRAAVVLSPPQLAKFMSSSERKAIRSPILHIVGEEEASPIWGDEFEDRRSFFRNLEVDEQYLVVLKGAEHSTFSDDVEEPDGGHTERIRYIQRATILFWDAIFRERRKLTAEMFDDLDPALAKAGDRVGTR